jgi:hypothetical protein
MWRAWLLGVSNWSAQATRGNVFGIDGRWIICAGTNTATMTKNQWLVIYPVT